MPSWLTRTLCIEFVWICVWARAGGGRRRRSGGGWSARRARHRSVQFFRFRSNFFIFGMKIKKRSKRKKVVFPSRQKFHPWTRRECGAHGHGVRDIVLDDGCGNDFFFWLMLPAKTKSPRSPPFLSFPAKFEVIVLVPSFLSTGRSWPPKKRATTPATQPPTTIYHLPPLHLHSSSTIGSHRRRSRLQFVAIRYHLTP